MNRHEKRRLQAVKKGKIRPQDAGIVIALERATNDNAGKLEILRASSARSALQARMLVRKKTK